MGTAFEGEAIARVVLRSPNWLGDAIMALPAMAACGNARRTAAIAGRRAFPQAALAVAAPPSVAPLFAEITAAAPDEVLAVEPRGEIAAIRAGRFDLAILLPNSFRSAWVARRAGVPQRWGVAAGGRRWLLTRAVRRARGRRHQSAHYLDLIAALGITAGDELPRVAATAPTRQRALELLDRHGVAASAPLVGLAPGAAYGHAKRWPPRRVAELAARLGDRGVTCLLVGAAGDRDAGREIESALPATARLVNLIGRTDLRVLTGLLARCQAFVSNDSGAMHLAAAVGVPVSAIFGPTDERVTAPLGSHDVIVEQVFCRPCMLRDCPIDHRCMKRISVERVYQSVARHLPAAAAGGSE